MEISGTKFSYVIITFWQCLRVVKITSATKSSLSVKADEKCPQIRNVKEIFALIYFFFLNSWSSIFNF